MINKVAIRNYLGIELAEYTFNASGALIEGKNRSGKTSVLEAIRAALTGQGCSPTSIRKGATASDIMIDLDDLSIRRLITAHGSTVNVTRDGMKQKAPQTFLNELLGVAPLDPIKLVFEPDAKKRRATILAAMPVRVTPELLERWLPDGEKLKPEQCAGHGLEVLATVRQFYYDRRTVANKALEAAEQEAWRQAAALAQFSDTSPADRHELEKLAAGDGITQHLATCRRELSLAEVKRSEASTAVQRNAKTKERAERLRSAAALHRKDAVMPTEQQIASALHAVKTSAQAVANLEEKLSEIQARLAAAKADNAKAIGTANALEAQEQKATELRTRAAEAEDQAAELEATIATPDAEELVKAEGAAREKLAQAERLVEVQKQIADRALASTQALEADRRAIAAKRDAYVLDKTVRALTHDAPAALLAAAGAIPGLDVEGDTIKLDGVSIDNLSGAEHLTFAVEIARRLNTKSKLIIVDGLEALDSEQLPIFLAAATKDGYQVIATRVGRGEAHAVDIGAGQ